jgi:hypothetical protein
MITVDHTSQRPDQIKIASCIDLDEGVGRGSSFRWLRINDNDVSPRPALRNSKARLFDEALHVSRVTFERIASPVNDKIGSILNLAQ